jgi:hypothetical protein
MTHEEAEIFAPTQMQTHDVDVLYLLLSLLYSVVQPRSLGAHSVQRISRPQVVLLLFQRFEKLEPARPINPDMISSPCYAFRAKHGLLVPLGQGVVPTYGGYIMKRHAHVNVLLVHFDKLLANQFCRQKS